MALTNREQEMINDTDVVGHIQRVAADIKAEAEEQGSTFYMVPTTLWAERGDYANVYEYERSMALGEYSDIHKEERGFRPREDLSNLTLEGIEALILECLPSEQWLDEESALEMTGGGKHHSRDLDVSKGRSRKVKHKKNKTTIDQN